MSSIHFNPNKGFRYNTGVQTAKADGATYYYGSRGAAGVKGNAKGAEWVLVDSNSDGKIDGGARNKGAINSDGEYIYRQAIGTPGNVKVNGKIHSKDFKAVWNNYV